MTAVAIAKQERVEQTVLSFSPFRLDLVAERIWKGDRELRLRRKPFAILRYLAQRPGTLATHAEIVEAVWGKIAMSESLLRTHVRDLRRVLGEPVIETVVGRGYRFVAEVSGIDDVPHGKRLAGKRPLELVRTSGSPSPRQANEVAPSVHAVDKARILRELTGALTKLGIKATVLLIVDDEQGERIATLLGGE